jgi:hypothetical protein
MADIESCRLAGCLEQYSSLILQEFSGQFGNVFSIKRDISLFCEIAEGKRNWAAIKVFEKTADLFPHGIVARRSLPVGS